MALCGLERVAQWSAAQCTAWFRVCQSGKPVLEGSKALEVVCPASAGACVAVAEVPLDKVSGVAKALENKAPLTAHPAGSACS